MTIFTPTPELTITPKPWYESRTVWFNIGGVVAQILAIVSGAVTDPKIISEIAIAQSFVNILLRFLTSEPVR